MTANTDGIYYSCPLSQAQHGESNASFQISTSCRILAFKYNPEL